MVGKSSDVSGTTALDLAALVSTPAFPFRSPAWFDPGAYADCSDATYGG